MSLCTKIPRTVLHGKIVGSCGGKNSMAPYASVFASRSRAVKTSTGKHGTHGALAADILSSSYQHLCDLTIIADFTFHIENIHRTPNKTSTYYEL